MLFESTHIFIENDTTGYCTEQLKKLYDLALYK